MCSKENQPATRELGSRRSEHDCERQQRDIGPSGLVDNYGVISGDQLDRSRDLKTKVGCYHCHGFARKRKFRQSRLPGSRRCFPASPSCTRWHDLERNSVQECFDGSVERLQADVVITNSEELSSPVTGSGMDRHLIPAMHRGARDLRQARPPAPLQVGKALDFLGFLAELVAHATPELSGKVIKVIGLPGHVRRMEFFAFSSQGHTSGLSSPAAGRGAGASGRRFD